VKLENILTQIEYLKFVGNPETHISNVAVFDELNSDNSIVMWVNSKNLHRANELKVGTLICESINEIEIKPGCNYIITDRPRLLFNQVISILFPKKILTGISAYARCDASSVISPTAFIGDHVVIEANCRIGNNSHIGHNTVIKEGTVIGNDVLIGSNNVIGGIGFGYEKDIDGQYIQINHIGNVLIEDGVEIGNNTCIDRAVLGSTWLKNNCKIDNLVHIAHGAVIGENSLIIAHAMIAGSSIIGKNVWVAPGAQILNKISIADNSTVGMGAVVLKTVSTEADVVVGNPAKSIKKSNH
jgi:UDP-3-O-[3-hydroxymyristoyl] glucosamine N-acyltransferase